MSLGRGGSPRSPGRPLSGPQKESRETRDAKGQLKCSTLVPNSPSRGAPASPQGQFQGQSGQVAGPSRKAEIRKSLCDNS